MSGAAQDILCRNVIHVLFLRIKLKIFAHILDIWDWESAIKNLDSFSHSFKHSFFLSAKLVTTLEVTVLVLFPRNFKHLCVYMMHRDTRRGFLNFWFFSVLVGLSQFLRGNPDHFKSSFYGFYGVHWPFCDYFIQ